MKKNLELRRNRVVTEDLGITAASYRRLQRETEEECDELLMQSKYKNFPAVESEIDGELCKYFDEEGNCVVVNYATTEIHYYSKEDYDG